MSLVLILLKRFFFSLRIKLTQRLCFLLYVFLSISFFVFKNLFLRRDLFMISLFIFLYMFLKALGLNSFIKSCFKSIKLKILVLRNHLNYTIFNVKHKLFIRKAFIIPIPHHIWFCLFIHFSTFITFITVTDRVPLKVLNDRVLFRFLSERVFLRILNDRFFFRVLSTRFRSWALGPLFPVCPYFRIKKNVRLLYFIKTDVLLYIIF